MVDSHAFAVSVVWEGYRVFLLGFAGSRIQLVPDGTLLFHLALIVVMVVLLNVTLLRPINRILEQRERRTKGRLTEAHGTLLAAQEKLAEYEWRLREARAEGYAQMDEERAVLTREGQRQMAQVKAEIARSLSEEKRDLAIDVQQAKGKLAVEARTMASLISRQILRRPIAGKPSIT